MLTSGLIRILFILVGLWEIPVPSCGCLSWSQIFVLFLSLFLFSVPLFPQKGNLVKGAMWELRCAPVPSLVQLIRGHRLLIVGAYPNRYSLTAYNHDLSDFGTLVWAERVIAHNLSAHSRGLSPCIDNTVDKIQCVSHLNWIAVHDSTSHSTQV